MKNLIIVCMTLLCVNADLSSQSSSIAKHWNEFTLEAIRNDLARPTVHARNLFHLSVIMYDAWAAYDDEADPYMLGQNLYGFDCVFTGVPMPQDVEAARKEAISHAAFSFLRLRYSFSPDYFNLLTDLQNEMTALGYNPFNSSTDYTTGDPAALGNYIASCMNAYGWTDGANQASNYGNQYYNPVNPPLDLTLPGNTTLVDFNRWQPLAFQIFIDQSGNPIPGGSPPFLSPEWGNVNPFSFTAADKTTYTRDGNEYNVYCDPGPPPLMTDQADDDYKWGFSMVSIWGSHLDPDDGVLIDISPGALGNLSVSDYPSDYSEYRDFYKYEDGGTYLGNGRALNPATGQPYEPNIVKRGDYARILAEFWADGPDSETPPGHWFTILNYVLDHPQFSRRYKGEYEMDQLEYDIKAYFLLGAAMHDAAITAWGIKGWYDYIRPVSAIRGMAEAGQSSDSSLPNYSTDGIPLVPGYIELIEAGDPLAGPNGANVNKIKLYTWRGHDYIDDVATDYAGVGWILAENWWPYQRPTFVTPNFAGYVSGHSTYSRAAAEVLTTLTGSEFFPGGMGEFNTVKNEFLVFEDGPSEDVTLQWATYRDASDQTSLSRIWGGIHPPADDIPGRLCGLQISSKVFNLAEQYFFDDLDGDGFFAFADCDDLDPDIYPGAEGTGPSIACNDHIVISLDEDCSLGALDVDIFIEGDVPHEDMEYRFLDPFGNEIDLNNLGAYLNVQLTYEVFDACSASNCWGYVTIEDKTAPTIDCECETPYLADGVTPNPDCTFNCYEVWDLEELEDPQRGNNEVLPDADDNTPEDNCWTFGDPAVALSYSDGPNCGEQIVTRELLWTYVDSEGETQYLSCTQNFLFDNLELTNTGSTSNGTWDGYPDIFTANSGDRPVADIYTPEQIVTLSCGAGTEPADVAAAYDIDTPGRPAGIDRDDHSQTPNLVEHNEGIPYAYPYVVQAGWAGRFHAKPIDNNICNIYQVYNDLTYDSCAEDCFGNSKIARTWTILDWCSASTIEFVQTIKRIDTEGPAVSGPNFTVSVDPWGCGANFEIPAPEHLLDDCDKNPSWSVEGPLGIEISNGVALELPKGTTTLTYVAEDCCGNQSFFPFNVTVEDRTAPTAIALQNIVVQLSNDQDGDGHAKLYAVDVDNASHDGCTVVHFEIRRNGNDWCNPGSNTSYNNDGHPDDLDTDVDNGEYVIFCCEDAIDVDSNGVAFGLHDVLLRVWDDGDMNGVFGTEGDNYNEIWTTVKVEDKSEPVVVCPPHIELSCNEDYLNYDLTGRPYGFSTCGDIVCDMEPSDNFRSKNASQPPFVGEAIPAYNPSCRRGAIQRTWSCEGKTCTQWIIMRDTEDGDLEITWPEDKESDCIDIDAGEPDIVERLCELSGTSLESDTFYFEDGACYKILNHWTVINWCDYDADDTDLNDQTDDDDDGFVPGLYTHTQVLKLIDTEKPTITTQDSCFAVNADCVGEGIQIWAGGADNGICSSAWLKWEAEVDMNSDWVVDYTFSSWFAPDDPFYIAPTAGDVHIDLPDGLPNGCASTHRVRWTVSDGCGNDTQATSFFTIEDKKKPTPYMLNLSTALMADGSVELWASDFDTGSFDNCSPQDFLLFTFSSTVPPQLLDPEEEDPWYDADGAASENDYNNGNAELWDGEAGTSAMVFTDEDLAAGEANGGLLEVPVYVWDLCGNSDFAIVNLQLVDNGGSANIEGRVATEAGIGVEGVTMTATSAQAGYPATTMTEADGEYMFEFNPMYNDYTLTGEKNDDWLNGVTTLDILLIQRHILSIEELDSPYKMIAADASNDEKISAVDLIQLRKLILGLTSELPNNDSWRFTDADASMDSSNPWPFSEFVNVTDLQSNMVENFVATKVGDVNGSVELFLQGHSTDTRSGASLNMNIEQSALAQGITELRFKSSNFSEISGFQFTLEANVTEIVELTSGLLTIEEGNVGLVDGALAMSWNTSKMVSYGEDVLFTLKVKKSDSKVSLSDRITQTEAYQGSGFEAINLILEEAELAINSLGQNEPNPWRAETVINFSLAEAGTASITVYDVTGKVLFVTEADYTAGTHEVNLKGRDLTGAAGVLYYKLESGEFSDTKKMIYLD